ncbi:N-acetylglucosamine-6-phosphate deacetylase [Oscillospiraceae bacterium PP1C4]
MIIQNGMVFQPNRQFSLADIVVNGDRISEILPPGSLDGDVIDAKGCYVVPGFVDIHIHGAAGSDFCDGTRADFLKISSYLGSQGVTSFCGTSMALDEPSLCEIFSAAGSFIGEENPGCAMMRGINMEGPFFSTKKKGAQCEDYLIAPDTALFHRLNELSGHHVLLVDVAPELDGADAFIREVSPHTVVSLAHTTAGYDCAAAGFTAGASHVTHLFNAMPSLHHRDPGVIGAASDYAAHVELISDGIHMHPSVVRAVFKWFGAERVCLISDAMRACGMPDGEYSLGGQDVKVADGKATLADGTIAGSATNLAECFRRAVSFGVPLESALCAVTESPAKTVGLFDELGSIEKGKRADILILNQDLSLNRVIIGGK